MSDKKEADKKFYGQLFSKAGWTLGTVVIVTFLYVLLLPKALDNEVLKWAIVTITIIKAFLIVRITFKQLSKILGDSHYLEHVLCLFALIVSLVIISFSTVGYGDFMPLSLSAKFLVILETILYFFVLVFGTANINRINIKD